MFSYSTLSSALTQTIPLLVAGRHAAVAMIFDDQQRVLMMQRAKHKDDPWSGQGFPGGGYEEQDASIRQTAERECLEEISIDLVGRHILGGLRRLNQSKVGGCVYIYYERL